MKRKKILFTIICFLMLFITGCGNKKVITTDDFISKTKEMGYESTDITPQYASYGYIKEATVARSKDGYQVEFYVLDDKSHATSMFNTNKSIFESYKGNTSAETSANMGNYSSYTLSSSGYYMHICRVNNTLLYAKVKDQYKENAKKIIEVIIAVNLI